MVLRQIECLEVVVVLLDLRAFLDGEAHAEEDVLDALERQRQRMQMAERLLAARQRDVDLLALETCLHLAGLEFLILLLDESSDLRLRLVDDLADLRPVFLCQRSHAAQDGRELALLAEELDADIVELREIPCSVLDCLGSLCLQLFNLVLHTDLLENKKPPPPKTRGEGRIRGTTLICSFVWL